MNRIDPAAPITIHLADYLPPAFLIESVDLVFYLYPGATRVRSRLAVFRNPKNAQPDLRLDGEGLTPIWVRLDGCELETGGYAVDEHGLTLFSAPDQFILETEVEIHPEDNTLLEGLYQSGGKYCTQCEAEGFRRITWYLDRPDVMASFQVRIEADRARYPVLLSNGNPRGAGLLPGERHYAAWEDPFPKPCYLFALVAGDLRAIEDVHVTPSGRSVRLRVLVEPENIHKCDHAMLSLKKAMRWDEQTYGREYDLEEYNIVAVNDFNMGAMENKGLNIFNSKYVLADPQTATDQDFLGVESVIAHEYFHNWTGNRITCRDWFQLSLKEGFTVFRDQEFSADMNERALSRIQDVRQLRAVQFAEDQGPMAHPVRPVSYIEINNFYTATVYEKGAEVVRMQAQLLGSEVFRKATDLYFQRFDGMAVTTDDFVACMAEASGRDLTQFKHWYDYAGTPDIQVERHWDGAGRFSLRLSQRVPDTQGQANKPPFVIPVALGLLDEQGNDLIGTRLLELTQSQQEFNFDGLSAEPVPSLLRGFSAPVKLHCAFTDAELSFLMARDSDGFARWDAAQTLHSRKLLQAMGKDDLELDDCYLAAFRTALMSDTPPGLLAEVLALPPESYLGDQMDVVDVDGIHSIRQFFRAQIASELEKELLATYQRLADEGEYLITPEAIGKRSLKNLALSYLMAGGTKDAREHCLTQYRQAHNMTDRMAALALIADSNLDERALVLADFAEQWRHDPLVMDKWFAVQAQSSRLDTLKKVEALCTHPAFSITNPNKVYSLILRFASGNPVRFHAADGSGYRFLADRLLELDPLNPSVAARIGRSLSVWHRYDAGRQQLMRSELERLAGTPGLSRNLFEVVSRSLA